MTYETMVTIRCFKCTMEFQVATSWQKNRVENKDTFYCPVGHPQHYTGENTEERLAAKVDELARVRAELYVARDDKQRAEAKLTRMSKRIHAGVCPKCNRTFQNVARHMQAKHKAPNKPSATGDPK